ncbi:hypothetical protein MP228_005934 [Amoeboaphelidium protococcarum]|nr:hypothetical protein MP228_005934 [Amoeboaphelidium protococcarum]
MLRQFNRVCGVVKRFKSKQIVPAVSQVPAPVHHGEEDSIVVKSTTSVPTYSDDGQKLAADVVNIKDDLQSIIADRDIQLTSGVPPEMTRRRVQIYKAAKSVMQSGPQSSYYRIQFDPDQDNTKWDNKLMGWSSTNDPVQAVNLKFNDVNEAIRFAMKNGWDYVVNEPQYPKFTPKSYADNFKYQAGQLRFVKTK